MLPNWVKLGEKYIDIGEIIAYTSSIGTTVQRCRMSYVVRRWARFLEATQRFVGVKTCEGMPVNASPLTG